MIPTKEEFEKAQELVHKYQDIMYENEQQEKVEAGKKHIGVCAKFNDSTGGGRTIMTCVKVVGVDTYGYQLIVLSNRSTYGHGYSIELTQWSFGMETYFEKKISQREFAKQLKRHYDKITETEFKSS